MKRGFVSSLAMVLAFTLGSPGRAVEEPDPEGGWRSLFDGQSLDGWEHVGPGRFVLEDGVLRTEGGMGLLWYTRETFGDCVIRVVYQVTSPRSNSGVFVRIADPPEDEWYAVHHGYEIQICDGARNPISWTGAVYSFAPASARAAKSPGEWNTMDITLDGPRIVVTLNGQTITEFDPDQPVPPRRHEDDPKAGPRPEAGYLGLQNHDERVEDTHTIFKKVLVRPLGD